MDEKSLDKSLLDRNVIESENHVFGSYDGIYLKYNTINGENSFDQRIYLLCPEEYRVLILYIGNTISKEEAYKFADNLVITEEDEMIKTADMTAWSDIIEPTVYADKIDVTNGQLSVRLTMHHLQQKSSALLFLPLVQKFQHNNYDSIFAVFPPPNKLLRLYSHCTLMVPKETSVEYNPR
jgi:hypothetical protein